MAIEFDPAWEYWTPSAEWAEAFPAHSGGGFAALGIEERRTERAGGLVGFRFGTGNPNRFNGRLGPERPTRETLANRRCPGCDRLFAPDRSGRRFCSAFCRPYPGRPKGLPRSAACEACGAAFTPDRSGRRFCSRRCAAPTGSPAARLDYPLIAELYGAGRSLAEITARVGGTRSAVQKAVRKLGLPRRPSGRTARGAA